MTDSYSKYVGSQYIGLRLCVSTQQLIFLSPFCLSCHLANKRVHYCFADRKRVSSWLWWVIIGRAEVTLCSTTITLAGRLTMHSLHKATAFWRRTSACSHRTIVSCRLSCQHWQEIQVNKNLRNCAALRVISPRPGDPATVFEICLSVVFLWCCLLPAACSQAAWRYCVYTVVQKWLYRPAGETPGGVQRRRWRKLRITNFWGTKMRTQGGQLMFFFFIFFFCFSLC